MRIARAVMSGIAAIGILAAAPVAVSASPAVDATAGSPAVVVAAQEFWWEWSDGSTALRRTFTQSRYGTQSRLPHLVAHAEPAQPRRTIVLEYWQRGAWHVENSVKTNSQGVATIDINPYCDGSWCDGTWKYRMTVAGQVARLTITFAEG